jgi:type I restriction enzyme, S subunit
MHLERTWRLDSTFYSKINLQASMKLDLLGAKPITEFANVSDGNHMSISEHFVEVGGVPYYRGQDIYHFFIEQSKTPTRIDEKIFHSKIMARSLLRQGDVLMSIVGAIIGNLSLVKTNVDATCSCKLAILRPKTISPELLAIFLKSYFGQVQVQKFKRGTAQTGLILEDFDQIIIPEFSNEFQDEIIRLVQSAFNLTNDALQKYNEAEALLLGAVNMVNFTPLTGGINIKSYKDSFVSTCRLDAEYYQPKYEQLITRIKSQPYASLIELVKIKKSIEPGSDAYSDDGNGLPFLRVADYSKFGLTRPQKSLNNAFVAENNRFIDMLKPKKNTILFSKDGSVGEAYCLREDADFITSGAVLHLDIRDTSELLPEYLTLVLNSTLVKMQAERDAGGSIILHWRLDEIENTIVPLVDLPAQAKIADLVNESFSLKGESEQILNVAKRAVEIAIEQNENAGMKYIRENS